MSAVISKEDGIRRPSLCKKAYVRIPKPLTGGTRRGRSHLLWAPFVDMGRDRSGGTATCYGLDRSDIAPVQTGPGAHLPSYRMGRESNICHIMWPVFET